MPAYTLYTDVRFTRKKALHHILNEHDDPVWSGQTVAKALSYLLEFGETECLLEGQTPDERFLLTFHRQ